MHLDPAVPGDLRDRIGQLLEPWLVGATAVVEVGMREDDDFLVLVAAAGAATSMRETSARRTARAGTSP